MALLCTDFDGTVYFPDNPSIYKANLESLKSWREAGNMALLITGRTHAVITRILPDWTTYFDYLATNNGGEIYNQSNQMISSYPFHATVVDDILAASPSNALPVFYYPHTYTTDRLPDQNPTKLRLWFHTLDQLWEMHKALSNGTLEAKSLPWDKPGFSPLPGVDLKNYQGFIDLVPSNSGKENTITNLGVHIATSCLHAQFTYDDILTVGDDYNDISMLESYPSYAISTAPAEVIQAASGRTIHSVSALISLIMSQS